MIRFTDMTSLDIEKEKCVEKVPDKMSVLYDALFG